MRNLDVEALVREAARLIEAKYAFQDKAPAIAAGLLSALASEDLADQEVDRAFCRRMTRLVQDLSGDAHMGFAFHDTPQPMRDEATYTFGQIDDEDRAEARWNNAGFHTIQRLAGNVGYVDLREFVHPELSAETADAALRLLAHTDALIIDLRRNEGGRPEMVRYLASFFFAERTQLSTWYNHLTQEIQENWTTPRPHSEHPIDRPLFLLTSAETFSAGEAFAYDMKHLGRATVIGETTAGGAHRTKIYTLSPHVWMAIPYGHAVNPITGTDWEGTGVEPNVTVPADTALGEAYRAALTAVRDQPNLTWPAHVRERFAAEVHDALAELSSRETDPGDRAS